MKDLTAGNVDQKAREHDLSEGWYEFINRGCNVGATTNIAHVQENGGVYLPEGPVQYRHFFAAADRGEAYRLIRADDLTVAQDSAVKATEPRTLTPEDRALVWHALVNHGADPRFPDDQEHARELRKLLTSGTVTVTPYESTPHHHTTQGDTP